jgi:hypothetical protein
MVDVDGHRLRVSIAGSGPPLLLLNGFGVSIEPCTQLPDTVV